MKSLLVSLGLIVALVLVNWFIPAWWWILIMPFVFTLFFIKKVLKALVIGLIAGLVVWGGFAAYQFLTGSDIIAGRMAELFGLQSGVILLVVVSLLGALFSCFAAMTGASLRALFIKEKKFTYY